MYDDDDSGTLTKEEARAHLSNSAGFQFHGLVAKSSEERSPLAGEEMDLDRYLNKIWAKADTDKNGNLSFS